MATKIEPTIGRVVWFWPPAPLRDSQPRAATIASVLNNGRVNIGYLDWNGVHRNAVEVLLVQDGEPRPADGFCEWMPYQKGQAARTEALEKTVAEGFSRP